MLCESSLLRQGIFRRVILIGFRRGFLERLQTQGLCATVFGLAEIDRLVWERNFDAALVEDAFQNAIVGTSQSPLLAGQGFYPRADNHGAVTETVQAEPFQVT